MKTRNKELWQSESSQDKVQALIKGAKGFLQTSAPKHHTAMGHMFMPNFLTRKSSKDSMAKELFTTGENMDLVSNKAAAHQQATWM